MMQAGIIGIYKYSQKTADSDYSEITNLENSLFSNQTHLFKYSSEVGIPLELCQVEASPAPHGTAMFVYLRLNN